MRVRSKHNICNETLFNEIFKRYSTDLYKFLYYKYGAENNPMDLVQESFLKLWDNCHRVTPDKARSYLFTVANHKMLNELAKKKTVLKYSQKKSDVHSFESPQEILVKNEYMDQLKNALEHLSEEQRVTLLLNRIEGKRHKEIADMLGISRKAVEKRIYTALAILRDKMGKI